MRHTRLARSLVKDLFPGLYFRADNPNLAGLSDRFFRQFLFQQFDSWSGVARIRLDFE